MNSSYTVFDMDSPKYTLNLVQLQIVKLIDMKLIDSTCRVSNHSGYKMVMNYFSFNNFWNIYPIYSSQQLAAGSS